MPRRAGTVAEPSTNRISSAEIMERFNSIEYLLGLRYNPAPYLIYKPNSDVTKGSAMKMQYKIQPTFSEVGHFLGPGDKSGMFIDLSAQTGVDENGNAKFNWDRETLTGTPQALITAKIGIQDIQALLLGIEHKRNRQLEVPPSIRPQVKDSNSGKWGPEAAGNAIGLVHKFNKDTTFIEMRLMDRGSFLTISRLSTKLKRFTSLTLTEEVGFAVYLRQALSVLFEVGLR